MEPRPTDKALAGESPDGKRVVESETPVRDRLEKILFPIIATPYIGFLCLRVGWKWFRFLMWASRSDDA